MKKKSTLMAAFAISTTTTILEGTPIPLEKNPTIPSTTRPIVEKEKKENQLDTQKIEGIDRMPTIMDFLDIKGLLTRESAKPPVICR